MYKKTLLSILILFLSSASQALKFNYDNYSEVSGLKYSFTFNGNDWVTPDVFGVNSQAILQQRELNAVEFEQIPKAWKVETSDNIKLYCWDKADKTKKFNNILELNRARAANHEDLLLDVFDYGTGISMHVTDMDGNGVYSNTIICSIE